MGIRGEIFSTSVQLANRTYFFNVKENRLGDLYLNIVESKNRETGGFERQSVILFADDLGEFLKGFDESLRVLEKASREKRRNAGGSSRGAGPAKPSGGEGRGAGHAKYSKSEGRGGPSKPYGNEGRGPGSAKRPRRVVVKKKHGE
jgi:hypothetical protein